MKTLLAFVLMSAFALPAFAEDITGTTWTSDYQLGFGTIGITFDSDTQARIHRDPNTCMIDEFGRATGMCTKMMAMSVEATLAVAKRAPDDATLYTVTTKNPLPFMKNSAAKVVVFSNMAGKILEVKILAFNQKGDLKEIYPLHRTN